MGYLGRTACLRPAGRSPPVCLFRRKWGYLVKLLVLLLPDGLVTVQAPNGLEGGVLITSKGGKVKELLGEEEGSSKGLCN